MFVDVANAPATALPAPHGLRPSPTLPPNAPANLPSNPTGHPAAQAPATPAARSVPTGVLAFTVGDESYAVDILQVREIRSSEPVLRIAGAPADVLGVIHLRGHIVPLVCLRRRLGLGPGDEAGATRGAVIVVDDGRGGHVGAVVDAVSAVVDLLPSQLRSLPAMPSSTNGLSRHLLGMASTDDALLLLVDLRGLLQPAPGAASLAPASAPNT